MPRGDQSLRQFILTMVATCLEIAFSDRVFSDAYTEKPPVEEDWRELAQFSPQSAQ